MRTRDIPLLVLIPSGMLAIVSDLAGWPWVAILVLLVFAIALGAFGMARALDDPAEEHERGHPDREEPHVDQ